MGSLPWAFSIRTFYTKTIQTPPFLRVRSRIDPRLIPFATGNYWPLACLHVSITSPVSSLFTVIVYLKQFFMVYTLLLFTVGILTSCPLQFHSSSRCCVVNTSPPPLRPRPFFSTKFYIALSCPYRVLCVLPLPVAALPPPWPPHYMLKRPERTNQ